MGSWEDSNFQNLKFSTENSPAHICHCVHLQLCKPNIPMVARNLEAKQSEVKKRVKKSLLLSFSCRVFTKKIGLKNYIYIHGLTSFKINIYLFSRQRNTEMGDLLKRQNLFTILIMIGLIKLAWINDFVDLRNISEAVWWLKGGRCVHICKELA